MTIAEDLQRLIDIKDVRLEEWGEGPADCIRIRFSVSRYAEMRPDGPLIRFLLREMSQRGVRVDMNIRAQRDDTRYDLSFPFRDRSSSDVRDIRDVLECHTRKLGIGVDRRSSPVTFDLGDNPRLKEYAQVKVEPNRYLQDAMF